MKDIDTYLEDQEIERRLLEDRELDMYGDHSKEEYCEDAGPCPECGDSGTVVVRASDGRRGYCPVCGGE